MRIIQKAGVYFILLMFSAIVAGIYGAIHDQISYSLSREYYTQFKFIQFGLPWAYENPRTGAAYVGIMATWWMGVLVFLMLGLFGFMFRTPRQMAVNLAKSFLVVVVVAFITGLLGLVYGYYWVDASTIAAYMQWLPPRVLDPVQFIRVGYMHNASYLGGIFGLIAGITYLIVVKMRLSRLTQRVSNGLDSP